MSPARLGETDSGGEIVDGARLVDVRGCRPVTLVKNEPPEIVPPGPNTT